ncbi:helix-turn-helix transcriptional regulator [Nonomuraea sp. M3C6]|uniref:Helix-turn-helix transcriptional regulator n=1 Tax=Nonomuraea marmarensis TaxID=3351344 RepID=A0ABW7ATV1_9ACTN
MSSSSPLGQYLRARRELVQPEEVGLPRQERRRVPGLRREELAMLAGISGDYYLRLEQGKDRHPSVQVLDALARALRLDDAATAHLHQLAQPKLAIRRPARVERVPTGILHLLDLYDRTPAFVQNRFMDVLAANPLAAALSPNFAIGTNLLMAAFLDPADSRLYLDWDQVAEDVVAAVRPLAGEEIDSPRLAEIIGELSVRSDRFQHLWARHDVRPKTGGMRRLNHPQVGRIELRHEKLIIAGTTGQMLVIYHAEPGTPSADALALLTSLAAGSQAPASHTLRPDTA